jgi:hypothetical protein
MVFLLTSALLIQENCYINGLSIPTIKKLSNFYWRIIVLWVKVDPTNMII